MSTVRFLRNAADVHIRSVEVSSEGAHASSEKACGVIQ